MIKQIVLFLISLFLDGIMSLFFPYQIGVFALLKAYFSIVMIPVFVITSNEKLFFIMTVLFGYGMLYDLFYTNFFLLHALLFCIIGLFFYTLSKKINMKTMIASLWIGPLATTIYSILLALFCLLFQIGKVTLFGVASQMVSSLFLAIIYSIILFFLVNKNKNTSYKNSPFFIK